MIRKTSIVVAAFALGALFGPMLRSGGRATPAPAPGYGSARLSPASSNTNTPVAPARPRAQGRMTSQLPGGANNPRVTPVVLAVRKASPSVVNIQVGRLVQNRAGRLVEDKLGEGSGVIVDETGLVITNWHVVRFRAQLHDYFWAKVILLTGERYPAKVLSTSRKDDLALLAISQPDNREHVRFPPITMGRSANLMIGETVIAIGNPHGQANTVTSGVLSAAGRSLEVIPPGERQPIKFPSLLQTDAAINPGNSGGALLDVMGRLIGINTLVQRESENIGFAIPVDRVRQVFESTLLRFDKIDKFWTGLRIESDANGLRVASAAGPAANAGFRRGDRIRKIGDKEVANMGAFTKAMIQYKVGDRIPFELVQGSRTRTLYLRPWDRTQGVLFERAGLLVEPVDRSRSRNTYVRISRAYDSYSRLRARLQPLEITYVQKDGPADQLGLRKGDFIVGRFVTSSDFWGDIRKTDDPLALGVTELAQWLDESRRHDLEILIYREGDGLQRGELVVR